MRQLYGNQQLCELFSKMSKFRLFSSHALPVDNLGEISENGDGRIWCDFVGGVTGDIVIGTHLLLLGDRCDGLYKGSNSILLFKVAPQAIFGIQL